MTSRLAEIMSEEPLSKARLRFWLKFLKASGLIEQELRRRMRAELGTTLPRFDVMAALARAPEGLKMGEISERLRVSNGNITSIVNALTEEGITLRVEVPSDRRASRVRLTAIGRDIFTLHARYHEQWINELLGELDKDDLNGMVQRLDKFLGMAEVNSSKPAIIERQDNEK